MKGALWRRYLKKRMSHLYNEQWQYNDWSHNPAQYLLACLEYICACALAYVRTRVEGDVSIVIISIITATGQFVNVGIHFLPLHYTTKASEAKTFPPSSKHWTYRYFTKLAIICGMDCHGLLGCILVVRGTTQYYCSKFTKFQKNTSRDDLVTNTNLDKYKVKTVLSW